MAELSWVATTPLSRVLRPGRYGADAGAAGVSLTELRDFELVQIMARRGKWNAAAKAAKAHFGATAPTRPTAVEAGDTLLIWSGPDQFYALAARREDGSMRETAAQSFAGVASLSDQSDGRALIRIAGPSARAMLAKFCSLDLHPKVFPVGAAAASFVDHTAVTLWRGKDGAGATPAFNLLLFSSFAESLWRLFLDSGAEFGMEVGEARFPA